MGDSLSIFSCVATVWSFEMPFDTSTPHKINRISTEGIDPLPSENTFHDIHKSAVDGYRAAIQPGLMLSITCSYPEELSKWEAVLAMNLKQIIRATAKAELMMQDSSMMREFCHLYDELHREVADYYASKEFFRSTERAWKIMNHQYGIKEYDYDALNAFWCYKYEFACCMKNRNYRKIEKRINELRTLITSDSFTRSFVPETISF